MYRTSTRRLLGKLLFETLETLETAQQAFLRTRDTRTQVRRFQKSGLRLHLLAISQSVNQAMRLNTA